MNFLYNLFSFSQPISPTKPVKNVYNKRARVDDIPTADLGKYQRKSKRRKPNSHAKISLPSSIKKKANDIEC